MSLREAALTALFARLNASLAARDPAPVIRRNETVPRCLYGLQQGAGFHHTRWFRASAGDWRAA